VVVPVKKIVTGSHGGTGWWLVQRISSLVMLLAGTILLGGLWCLAPFDYSTWQEAFQNTSVKLLVCLLVVSVCLHAWIGLRDVLMDYVKPMALRLALNVLFALTLSLLLLWAVVILWGGNG
jgi:succinate dehydrogenase / fumarate reductase, membrane anchor subunit